MKLNRQEAIRKLVSMHGPGSPMENSFKGLPLAVPSFGAEEVEEAIEALLTGWITMGTRVAKFEQLWAAAVGVDHAIAVNSGSSALLVMLNALVEIDVLRRGQTVLVPAVGWSTSLFAVAQAGLKPVLIDVDSETLCIEGAYEEPVLAIHLLGCPSGVDAPLIIEDACGAHGAKIGNKTVGGLGICGAFSFFFSHHLSTGEGGMITTNDSALADSCRSLRAHGWIRERNDRTMWAEKHAEIDPRFLFVSSGYNLRMTDIAGAFGIHQVPRLPLFLERRRENHEEWCRTIQELNLPLKVFPEPNGRSHAAFAFPMLLDETSPISRQTLCDALEKRGIQTRPISGSHLARQPAFSKVPGASVRGATPVADRVHSHGFFVGQSHGFGPEQGALLLEALTDIFRT